MISIRKKFLFIHVPKTGGNSIQNILRDYSEDNIVILSKYHDGFERFQVRNSKYDIRKHSTLTDYKSVLNPTTYSSLLKFATIRNPWDRLISLYFSPHRGVTEWDRNDFLALVDSTPTLRYFICEEKVLEKLGVHKAIGNRKIGVDIDFLIRFERLHDDFKLVCEQLDIPYSPLPKRNSSVHMHYSRYYDDELREVVQQKFMEEIAFGNYRFENA